MLPSLLQGPSLESSQEVLAFAMNISRYWELTTSQVNCFHFKVGKTLRLNEVGFCSSQVGRTCQAAHPGHARGIGLCPPEPFLLIQHTTGHQCDLTLGVCSVHGFTTRDSFLVGWEQQELWSLGRLRAMSLLCDVFISLLIMSRCPHLR